MSHSPHPFAQYLKIIGRGKTGTRSLTEEEAFEAFRLILQQRVEPLQLGAFLMLLRVKEESVDELTGFVRAVREDFYQSNRFDLATIPQVDLDWSSYAGKRKQYPWFVLAALTLAKHGYRVFMHGSTGHTAGRLYTEHVLTALGYPICTTQSQVNEQLDVQRFAYMPLQAISPQLQTFIGYKQQLGLRSVVNTLVRLLNPYQAQATLHAIFHPAYRDLHQQTAQRLGYGNSAVMKGEGGEFERNPDARTLICGIKNHQPYQHTLPKLTPERSPIESDFDLAYFKAVWQGQQSHAYGEVAVIETLQIALYTMNICTSFDTARQLAQALWLNRHDVN